MNNIKCATCGGPLELTEEMRKELLLTPGKITLSHECPTDDVDSELSEYIFILAIERDGEELARIASRVNTTDVTAAIELTRDDLVQKWLRLQENVSLAETDGR